MRRINKHNKATAPRAHVVQPHYPLSDIFKDPLAALVDDYEIPMLYVMWKSGLHETEAVFHYHYRPDGKEGWLGPFKGGYGIAAGLAWVIDYVEHYRWTEEDLLDLANARGNDGELLYKEPEFIDYLRNSCMKLDIDAVPEGTPVFGGQPLIRVKGPIGMCLLLESALLNLCNFATAVATKASRIARVAKGRPLSDQGLRRAQGPCGALIATWAAIIGGFDSTSNRYASRLFKIPAKGTMAHAFIMAFADELLAFLKYADALPNNCVFLVDTYNTVDGIKNAIKVGKKLEQRGHKMIGIRLDSGDLAKLSQVARKMLDEAGLGYAKVFVANDLDENIIASLNAQDAKIDSIGVGTKIATAYDQPALGGVYKLGAIRDPKTGKWRFTIKLSENLIKVSTPGILNIRRFFDRNNNMIGDVLINEGRPVKFPLTAVQADDESRLHTFRKTAKYIDVLVPITRDGYVIYRSPVLFGGDDSIQAYSKRELAKLPDEYRRFENPARYPVLLEKGLHNLKKKLWKEHRSGKTAGKKTSGTGSKTTRAAVKLVRAKAA